MSEIMFMKDIVEDNGKTIFENNMEKSHNIPIDSLVEVKSDGWFGDGACIRYQARLWVVEHIRDCDGTPLYILSEEKANTRKELERYFGRKFHTYGPFPEESVAPVEVTSELKRGEGALSWGEE